MDVIERTDRYPSRIEAEPSLTPRRDPVVWGSEDDGPLGADQLAAFERDGYLVLEEVFSEEEAVACVDELARLGQDPEVLAADTTIIEPQRNEVRSLFAVHDHGTFGKVAQDARLTDVARQLLGSDVYVHQSRVNLKPGMYGKEFFWHSDFETWHVEDGMPAMRAVSASVSLTESNEFNGPLMVVPGSHRRYLSCVGETPERHYERSLRRQEYGVPDRDNLARLVDDGGIVAPKLAPGSVVLFDCNMMHSSGVNLSPYARSNLFVVFNSVENRLEAPFSGQPPRPQHLASRD